MEKKDLKLIVKKYYDALEAGIILGRKCTACGHIEFPPYLACNACGNLDTEWVVMNDVKATVNQIMPMAPAAMDPPFMERVGPYWIGAIQPEGAYEYGCVIVNVPMDKYEEAAEKVPLAVHPLIIPEVDTKIVVWEMDDPEYRLSENYKAKECESISEAVADAPNGGVLSAEKAAAIETAEAPVNKEMDLIAMTILECAAEAYGVAKESISLQTDIREELANESMKMIVMLSEIEDRLEISIEIAEAGNLNTLFDFYQLAKQRVQK